MAFPPSDPRASGAREDRPTDADGQIGTSGRRRRAERDPVDALVEDNLWLVPATVAAMRGSWPRHADYAELEAAGRLGLVEAAQRYEAERGPFVPFARVRVRGALLDALRSQDWAPRRLRSEGRHIDAAIEAAIQRTGRALVPGEQAVAAGVELERLERFRAEHHRATVLSLDAPPAEEEDEASLAELLLTPGETVEQRLEDVERRAVLADALAALDDRRREVIVESYLHGRSLESIAIDLQVTSSRISQLRQEALELLNVALETHWESTGREIDLTGRRARSFLENVARYRSWRIARQEAERRSADRRAAERRSAAPRPETQD